MRYTVSVIELKLAGVEQGPEKIFVAFLRAGGGGDFGEGGLFFLGGRATRERAEEEFFDDLVGRRVRFHKFGDATVAVGDFSVQQAAADHQQSLSHAGCVAAFAFASNDSTRAAKGVEEFVREI